MKTKGFLELKIKMNKIIKGVEDNKEKMNEILKGNETIELNSLLDEINKIQDESKISVKLKNKNKMNKQDITDYINVTNRKNRIEYNIKYNKGICNCIHGKSVEH